MPKLAAMILASLLLALPAAGQDFDKGLADYERGDYAAALKEMRPLAEQGLAFAQHNLGVMYEKGQGVKQDPAEAVKWYRRAAEQGNAKAQFNLGLMYHEGHCMKQDHAEAVKWFRRAAEQGHAKAQFNLGLMYANGQGVPQDFAEAAKWYRLAAEQGHAAAQNNLGFMYDNGRGVKQDHAEAVKWLRRAAEQGEASAQYNVGLMYDKGEGVRQDYVQAHLWYNLAASSQKELEKRDRAARNRDRIAAKMTPQQVAEAQRLAREWKPQNRRCNAAASFRAARTRPGAAAQARGETGEHRFQFRRQRARPPVDQQPRRRRLRRGARGGQARHFGRQRQGVRPGAVAAGRDGPGAAAVP